MTPSRTFLLTVFALATGAGLIVWIVSFGGDGASERGESEPSRPDQSTNGGFPHETPITYTGPSQNLAAANPAANQRSRPTSRKGVAPAQLRPPKPIDPSELPAFEPVPFPLGRPAYDGEPVTAYVRVGSLARDFALTVNQGGEFPRVPVQPGETVELRLAFTQTPPGTTVALNAEDGGGVRVVGGRGRSVAGSLDNQRQLAFSFRVTGTAGTHRVTVRVPSGETKVLEFWAGEPPQQKALP